MERVFDIPKRVAKKAGEIIINKPGRWLAPAIAGGSIAGFAISQSGNTEPQPASYDAASAARFSQVTSASYHCYHDATVEACRQAGEIIKNTDLETAKANYDISTSQIDNDLNASVKGLVIFGTTFFLLEISEQLAIIGGNEIYFWLMKKGSQA
jgi:hypothetical protein